MLMQSQMETMATLCFVQGQITYVPHYSKPGVYVGPGYGKQHMMEHTLEELVEKRLNTIMLELWPRPKRKEYQG